MQDRQDRELIELAAGGDKSAFGMLAERYQSAARRFAMRLTSDKDWARELTQEALLQAYLSLGRLHEPDKFKSWLFGIIMNTFKSQVRDRKIVLFFTESVNGGPDFEASLPDTADTPPEAVEENELNRKIMDAVNSLSSVYREVTLLFYFDQLRIPDIADLLGISAGTVKVRLHRARQQLKAELESLHADLMQIKGGEK